MGAWVRHGPWDLWLDEVQRRLGGADEAVLLQKGAETGEAGFFVRGEVELDVGGEVALGEEGIEVALEAADLADAAQAGEFDGAKGAGDGGWVGDFGADLPDGVNEGEAGAEEPFLAEIEIVDALVGLLAESDGLVADEEEGAVVVELGFAAGFVVGVEIVELGEEAAEEVVRGA